MREQSPPLSARTLVTRRTRRLAAAAAGTLVLLATVPAAHAAVPDAKAASADAYGVHVDLQLLNTLVPVRYGPVARASQDYPQGAASPAEASLYQVGAIPSDGSLVKHVGALSSIAGATGTPQAVASAEAADVSLLGQGDNGAYVTADLVRAQANSDCDANPNAVGTTFVNLKINGTPIENTPAPNTVVDLGFAKVILNEQRPAYDGRGIVVNAIHVISTTTGDALFRGDIVIAHAMSTVNCVGDIGSTGSGNVVQLVKDVDRHTAVPGDELTYTARVTNLAGQPCLVTSLIDHLPPGFQFVSTTGDLGSSPNTGSPTTRPGSYGVDVAVGNGRTIASGATVYQTFVVRVGSTVPPGVYYNNLEIFCANLGEFVKGLDAPVQVTETAAPSESPSPSQPPVLAPRPAPKVPAPNAPAPDAPLAHTGPSPLWAGAGLLLLALGALTARRARA